jgi:hypothetical protein
MLKIHKLVSENPFILSIWDSAKIYKGNFVMTSPERLAKFLKLRGLMFRHLYYNPASRFPEYVVSQYILKSMYRKKMIDRDELLGTRDWNLEDKINSYLGMPYFLTRVVFWLAPKVKTFSGEFEAEKYRQEIMAQSENIIAITEKFGAKTKTGADSFLVLERGQIKAFRDVCPDETRELEKIMAFDEHIRVYSFDIGKVEESTRARLRELLVPEVAA